MINRFSAYTAPRFFVTGLIVCAFGFVVIAQSQEQAPKVRVQKVPARQTGEVSGSKLYYTHCAVFHGQDGKGNGPAVPALKTAPPDLTLLAKNNGGKFPSDHVMNVLSNESGYPVHGSKDMPIWGPVFRRIGADQKLGYLRASNVTKYLESIQAK